MKPLFIPLKAEYYDKFASGWKGEELRKYGRRWNEKTCPVGRYVILSRGYGKSSRMTGTIASFKAIRANLLPAADYYALKKIYGEYIGSTRIAVIGIEDIRLDGQPVHSVRNWLRNSGL